MITWVKIQGFLRKYFLKFCIFGFFWKNDFSKLTVKKKKTTRFNVTEKWNMKGITEDVGSQVKFRPKLLVVYF